MQTEAAKNHLSWFGRGRERVELDGVQVFLGDAGAVLGFPEPGADLAGAVRLARTSARARSAAGRSRRTHRWVSG